MSTYPLYVQDSVGTMPDESVTSDASPRASREIPVDAVHQGASCEPSVVSGYFLLMFGAMDDLLDFVSGYFPGVASVVSFIPSTGQVIVVVLDPNLRKQASSDAFKLLMKRCVLIGAVWMVEGLPIVNLLPLQTAAAFAVKFIKVKQTKLGSKPMVRRR